jgi:TolB-like protein/class 3 adenylate cyclase
VPTQPIGQVTQTDLNLEIAHLLIIDIVGYSKLLVNEQIESVQELGRIVRSTECFRNAEAKGKLIRVPTGDGMALLFFESPEEPVRCALEIGQKLKETSPVQLRMGIHSGPVNQVRDVNDTVNVVGTGINVAQRVMDCGDAGHILLSKHVADDLGDYRHWQPYLHDFGECEVKHGMRLRIVNLCKDGIGNPALPEKLRRGKRWKQSVSVRPVGPLRVPKSPLIAALALSGLALVLSFAIFFRRATPIPSLSATNSAAPEKSIAVLPFENLSEDKQNAYFSDGVQDEILNSLSKVADLKVISRTSVMQYRSGTSRNLREIAKALGVAHVVEGSVQRVGERVRVSAQLIDARTDMHLWGEHYDRGLADVFAVESELAERIAATLKAKLSPTEIAAIKEQPTRDLLAHDLYLRAKNLIDTYAFSTTGRESLFEAERLLERATNRDPEFLLAYDHLARVHGILYLLGIDHTDSRLALASSVVQTMTQLKPNAGETHLARAQYLYAARRDYDQALDELATARTALPNEPFVFVVAAQIERRQGQWEKSVRDLQQALDLDPRNVFVLELLSSDYSTLHRFKEMADTLDRIVSINAGSITVRMERAWADLVWRANPQPLQAAIEDALKENPDVAPTISGPWMYLALWKRDNSALKRALAVLPADGCRDAGVPFPRAWCEGLAARSNGEATAARAAFIQARSEAEEVLKKQPDYPEELCVLGMIDAALGNKQDAIREGRRAVELLSSRNDAMTGTKLNEYLAVIYAWTGEKKAALDALTRLAHMPSNISYGDLRLDPYWDPIRGEPRFEKIVASLAPDTKKP